MNIYTIESFLTLCEYKNISVASVYLNITQQGLSRQILSLETELNVVLFKRTRSGVELTECGEILKPTFQTIYANYKLLTSLANSFYLDEKKDLKVGFGCGITTAIGLHFISSYTKGNPLSPAITTSEHSDHECFSLLSNGELDIAFLVEPFDKTNLECFHIFQSPCYASLNKNHPYASKDKITMSDLHKQSIMVVNEDFTMRKLFDKICREKNVKPHIVFSASSIASYIDLASEAEAIALITQYMFKYINQEYVTFIPLQDGPIYNVYCCYSKAKPPSDHLIAFTKHIKKHFSTFS